MSLPERWCALVKHARIQSTRHPNDPRSYNPLSHLVYFLVCLLASLLACLLAAFHAEGGMFILIGGGVLPAEQ